MMRPIRCFSCGKPLADKYEKFEKRVAEGEKPKDVLDDLGVERYCCRRMIIASVDASEEMLEFER